MALSITDLKKGTIFQLDGVPYRVVEYSQKVLGRGGSIVSVKIKSLLDGKVLDKTFKGSEQLRSADVTNINAQYLYNDGSIFYFMNTDNYEQLEVSTDKVADQAGYLKEGDSLQLQLFNGSVIAVELPKNVPLKVDYAEEVVRGDTANSLTKDATLETGIAIKVPSFIKQGDIVKVDTRTGAYIERVK